MYIIHTEGDYSTWSPEFKCATLKEFHEARNVLVRACRPFGIVGPFDEIDMK